VSAYKQITDQQTWNRAIQELPGLSILQSWEWGQIKACFGWQPRYFLWSDDADTILAAALVLIRNLPFPGLKTMYVPQGPLLDWKDRALYERVITDLELIAKDEGAFSLKIDPEVILSFSEEREHHGPEWETGQEVLGFMTARGYIYSSQQIQFKNTAWLRLDAPEEEILSAMKQKTRYNIRLADRKGVAIRRGTEEDVDLLYQMYLETSLRDGFIIRPRAYYQQVWSVFLQADMLIPLIAEVEQQPVAGLMLFHFGKRSWYLYGMSTSNHREKMPNYLLQWEAIRISKELGCEIYDLWGAPDTFDESDDMWGVYRFKQGLGAEPVQRIGAYDLPIKKSAYTIFIELIPRLQILLRKLRRKQQSQELDN
jgi:peptidoglycan pentaglycine glycine transferase (the first glycine)